jgi:hypothetical protein
MVIPIFFSHTTIMGNSYMKLSLVVLLGALTLGLSSVAQADNKWFETVRGYCPDVCQKNAKYGREENQKYTFAVPAGVHDKGKIHYICAVNYAGTGWRGGHNIDWGVVKGFCYAQWHKKDSGKNSYREHYLCLCTDQEMPPLEDRTGFVKRR